MEFLDKITALRPQRTFVPADFDIKDLETLEKLYLDLTHRQIDQVEGLKKWIRDRDELETVIEELASIISIVYSCETENKEKEADYLFVIQKIQPLAMKYDHELNKNYVDSPARQQLDSAYYAMYDKLVSNKIDLFREKNIPLITKDAEVSDQYSKITGSLGVSFHNKDYTVPQMGKFLLDPDRKTRQAAFEAVSDVFLDKVDPLNDIFNELNPVRQDIASNAGFDSYTDYIFREKNRFDYSPETCFQFHKTVEDVVVPLAVKWHKHRAKQMGLERLRPWDTAVDPLGRAALKPFEKTKGLIQGVQQICNDLDPTIGNVFKRMAENKTLDLDSRKGKRPGGYQADLPESKMQFIFMNAVGVHEDLVTLLHETGHAVHTSQASHHDLATYRGYPIEMAEVASMSMELLGMQGYKFFYKGDDAQRAVEDQLYRVVTVLPWVATVDAFQHWLYQNPNHTNDERGEAWIQIYQRFQPDIDWEGYEKYLANRWQRQLHIFLVPHYYIEYGFSQIGALQVWKNYLSDPKSGLATFLEGLKMGYSRSLPEQYEGVGIRFDFNPKLMENLMHLVSERINLS